MSIHKRIVFGKAENIQLVTLKPVVYDGLRMKEKTNIYGMFLDGKCRYVGQTLNPNKRRHDHKFKPSKNKAILELCTFRIIRKVDSSKGNEAERKAIAAMRSLGQADLNRQAGGSGGGAKGYRVYWPEKDMWFVSVNQASRYFKVSPTLIGQGAKRNGYFARTHGLIVEYPDYEVVQPYSSTDLDDAEAEE